LKKIIFFLILVVLILLVADLLTKRWAKHNLANTEGIEVIKGFWRFDYVENKNIAFSIGQQLPESVKQPLLIGIGILALVFLTIFIIQAEKSILIYISTVLIMAGALGNLIDRLFNGFVVDFIHWFYRGFDWPVFNLADAYITVGMILLITEFILISRQKKEVEKSKTEEIKIKCDPDF